MILNFRSQKQILSQWCWAAVASSVSDFYADAGAGLTQRDIATIVLHTDCSQVSPTNIPQDVNIPSGLGEALSADGNLMEMKGQLSFSELVDEIDLGRPVCCQIVWDTYQGRGHFVTIYGYDEQDRIYLGDPESRTYVMPYESFLQSYRGGIWDKSYFTRDS